MVTSSAASWFLPTTRNCSPPDYPATSPTLRAGRQPGAAARKIARQQYGLPAWFDRVLAVYREAGGNRAGEPIIIPLAAGSQPSDSIWQKEKK